MNVFQTISKFVSLAQLAGINEKIVKEILLLMTSKTEQVTKLIERSFLDDTTKRNYLQSYQGRLKRLMKE